MESNFDRFEALDKATYALGMTLWGLQTRCKSATNTPEGKQIVARLLPALWGQYRDVERILEDDQVGEALSQSSPRVEFAGQSHRCWTHALQIVAWNAMYCILAAEGREWDYSDGGWVTCPAAAEPDVQAIVEAWPEIAERHPIPEALDLPGLMIDVEKECRAAGREQNGNSDEKTSALKLPPEADLRELWTQLAEGQGKGKSDTEIARELHRDKGEGWLGTLKTRRTRGQVSNWRKR
jgi:hypothetical protein